LLILIGAVYFITLKNDFPVNSFMSITAFLIVLFLMFVPGLLYEIVCEQAMNGQTVGKRLRKIKVVSHDGSSVTLGKSIVRFIFKSFGFLLYGVVSIVVIFFSKKSQRLGDMVANTLVVNATNDVNLFEPEIKAMSRNRREVASTDNEPNAQASNGQNSNTHLDKFLKNKEKKEAKRIAQENQAKFNNGFGKLFSSNKKKDK